MNRVRMMICAVLASSACSDGGSGVIPDGPPADSGTQDGSVDGPEPDAAPDGGVIGDANLALYPANGARWGEWVKNDGAGPFVATGAACAPTDGQTAAGCLHAGELRVVSVTGRSSCAGLTAADDLGAFVWICDASTNPVRVISTGLAPGKRLADLLDLGASPVAFRTNVVRVHANASEILATAPSVWWSNPIVTANPVAGSGFDQAGTIYVFQASGSAERLVGANGTSFVVAPGARLSAPAGSGLALGASGRAFLWLEGSIGPGGAAVHLVDTPFAVLRALDVEGTGSFNLATVLLRRSHHARVEALRIANAFASYGVEIDASHELRADDVQITTDGTFGMSRCVEVTFARGLRVSRLRMRGRYGNGLALGGALAGPDAANSRDVRLDDVVAIGRGDGAGLLISAYRGVVARRVRVANHFFGIQLVDNSAVVLDEIIAVNNQQHGVSWLPSANVILSRALVVGTGNGLSLTSSDSNLVTSTLVANAVGHGLQLNGGVDNTLHGVALVNAQVGAHLNNQGGSVEAARNSFVDVAVIGHQDHAFHLQSTSSNYFGGAIKVGSVAPSTCSVSGGANQGIRALPGAPFCELDGASDGMLTSATAIGAFLGPVLTDDAVNSDDVAGLASPATDITDWLAFEHDARAFGIADSATFPGAPHRGRCAGAASCRIHDYSLASSGAVLRGVIALPGGDQVVRHTWRADASGCAEIPGAVFAAGTCRSVFLRGAVELEGNGNTLCESGETCLYTPNLGFYQGHGALVSAGTFVDGEITGVTLRRYATNGR